MRIVGIVLVILGALALGYGGFSYVTREKVVDAGPVQVTAEREKTVWIPPVVGGIALFFAIGPRGLLGQSPDRWLGVRPETADGAAPDVMRFPLPMLFGPRMRRESARQWSNTQAENDTRPFRQVSQWPTGRGKD